LGVSFLKMEDCALEGIAHLSCVLAHASIRELRE